MKKFEKVCKALEEMTYESDNYITVTKNIDGRHNGKYAIKNVITNSVHGFSFKTLKEIIEYYNLSI